MSRKDASSSDYNKLFFQKIIFIILMSQIFLITACTINIDNKNVGHQVWIPWPNRDGQYRLQKIQIDTINQWSPIRGSAINIRSHFTPINQTQATATEVVMDYTTDSSGAVIPMTQYSLEIASIYANFERLQQLDQKLGIIDSNIARNVYVKFKSYKDGYMMTNNALYNVITNAFYIVPYTNSGLPISVNGAILAHEHFHSIFGRLLQEPLFQYAKSKNVDLFEDYAEEENSFFKNEFGELYSENGLIENKDESPESEAKKEFREKLLGDSGVFANYHLNRIFLMALNEGLADVWAWLYSDNPCFIAPSLDLTSYQYASDLWGEFDSKIPTIDELVTSIDSNYQFKLDDHDNRCLNVKQSKLVKRKASDVINKEKLISVHTKMKKTNSKGLLKLEKDTLPIFGYRLGTNLARLLYHRLEERGEIFNHDAQTLLAKHIINILPQLLTKIKEVYVDGMKIKSLFPWDEAVDLLVFGEGSPDISKENCQTWVNTLNGESPLENFKKKCGL